MIELYDADSDTLLGALTDEQFQSLSDSLEEESTTDQDYYINAATIDMLDEEAADPDLIAMLRRALAGRAKTLFPLSLNAPTAARRQRRSQAFHESDDFAGRRINVMDLSRAESSGLKVFTWGSSLNV